MILGILLAAGLGRRIGSPKALLRLGDQTFHQLGVGAFREAHLEVVAVVNEMVARALPEPLEGETRVLNPDPDLGGMFSSVRIGIMAAIERGVDGVLVLPVDHPLVRPSDVRAVMDELTRHRDIVVPTHGGRRGHPIGLSRRVMAEIVLDSACATLRDVVHKDPERVHEVQASEGILTGINTLEDLARASGDGFR